MFRKLKIPGVILFLIIIGSIGAYCLVFDTYRIEMKKALKERREVVDGVLTPQMPSFEVNDRDVLGVDSNNNGVRDDIEIWINYVGKNYNERMALRQLASDLQYEARMLEKDINLKIVEHVESVVHTSNYCLHFIFKFEKMKELKRTLRALMINTEKREKVWDQLNHISYGYSSTKNVSSGKPYEACNFKIKDFDQLLLNYNQSLKSR